ncbi:hypothetical protein ABZP36_015300 [Zizania latifolia]
MASPVDPTDMDSIDLNSHVAEFSYLSSYKDILQSSTLRKPSSLSAPLAASLSAHPLLAVVAYLRLLLAPASPAPRCSPSEAQEPALQASSSVHRPCGPRRSFIEALSLLADAAGRLSLREHPDARRSLVDTATELVAFDVLAAATTTSS